MNEQKVESADVTTGSVTRYFAGEQCPTDPARQHAIRAVMSSPVPFRVISPALTDADIEWHWCIPTPPEERP